MAKKARTESDQPPKFSFINITKHKSDLRKKEPPLVDIEVSNPLTYLKSWWKRVMGSEGIDLRFRIRPLTALAMTVIIATCGFGLGRFALSFKKPYVTYIPIDQPAPTPEPTIIPWRETGFSGVLLFTQENQRYYLSIDGAEAISLSLSQSHLTEADLDQLVNSKVFVTGSYHSQLRLMRVLSIVEL